MGRHGRLTRPPGWTRRAQWFLGVVGRVLPAVSCGPRRPGRVAVAIGGEEGGAGSPGAATLGRSSEGEQLAWEALRASSNPACCNDPAGPWEAECAAAIRLGHGSSASESVHRGLGELVSSGGWAARAPPPGSLGSGRARAASSLFQRGHQGSSRRQRGGPAIACPSWALHAQRTHQGTSARGAWHGWPGWQRVPCLRAPVCALVTVRLLATCLPHPWI